MRERFIKISNNRFYLTNKDFIELNRTNLPADSLSFKYHLDIFLKVEISNYINNSLDIEIVDYNPKSEDFHDFNNQELKKSINRLNFKNIEWKKFEKLLTYYKSNLIDLVPDAFRKNIHTQSKDNDFYNGDSSEYSDLVEQNKLEIQESVNVDEIEEKTIVYDFEIEEYFDNATFHSGYASVFREFNGIKIELKVYNDNILSEYEYIKHYFSKSLNSQTFIISVEIEMKGEEIIKVNCKSEDIERINNDIVEAVRKVRIQRVFDYVDESNDDKNTFTADEVFERVDNYHNIFGQSETEIIDYILKQNNPRNKKQLVYLSSEKHKADKKIRFTLKPLFGFIFYINGEKHNHICWELLNSHATYIWSFDNSVLEKQVIDDSNTQISTIKEIGRKRYRNLIRLDSIETVSTFRVLNHSKLYSKDNFKLWKEKFEKILKVPSS